MLPKVLLMVLGVLVVGCSSSNPYVEPSLPANQTAVIKGKESVYIDSIDGKAVHSSHMAVNFLVGSAGGNEKRATPGRHRVAVSWTSNNWKYSSEFELICEAGHVYAVAPKSLVGPELELRDATTGKELKYTPGVAKPTPPTNSPAAPVAPK